MSIIWPETIFQKFFSKSFLTPEGRDYGDDGESLMHERKDLGEIKGWESFRGVGFSAFFWNNCGWDYGDEGVARHAQEIYFHTPPWQKLGTVVQW